MTTRRAFIAGSAAAAGVAALPRRAMALSSPFNFATLSASSQVKLLGCNIMQVPTAFISAPNTGYQYGTFFHTNWASIRTNWILPQLALFKRLGFNMVRLIGGTDGVITGGISQGTLETHMSQFCSDVRAQGLYFSTCGLAQQQLSNIGSPNAAAVWAPMASLITNVFTANQDIIAYIEPGMQESEGADLAVNNAVCALMKASGTTIPVGASRTGGVSGGAGGSLVDFSSYTPSNVDLFLLHTYPDNGGPGPVSAGFNDLRDYFYQMLKSTGGKPIFHEEFNLGSAGTATYQQKADFIAYLFEASFGHPDCMGGMIWGGQESRVLVGSNWGTLTCPGSFNPNAFDPTTQWVDTVASTMQSAWGTPNRNLVYVLSANGSQTIGSTISTINTNAVTRASAGTITNAGIGAHWWENTAVSIAGTATISGDSGTQYTVTFDRWDFLIPSFTNIGTVSRTGSGTVNINFSGTIPPGDSALVVRVQRGSGVDGTLTALAVTETIGNAPSLNPPKATPLVY